jgi:hypothetical protein
MVHAKKGFLKLNKIVNSQWRHGPGFSSWLLVAASSVWTMQRRKCLASIVKVFFDPMAAILPHQFDGAFSEMLFDTQGNHQFLLKALTKLL